MISDQSDEAINKIGFADAANWLDEKQARELLVTACEKHEDIDSLVQSHYAMKSGKRNSLQGKLIIEVIGADNLPQDASTVASLWLFDKNYRMRGEGTRTYRYRKTSSPRWRSYRLLNNEVGPHDILSISINNEDNYFGGVEIPVNTLSYEPMKYRLIHSGSSKAGEPAPTITIRRVHPPSTQKQIYFIRHGESMWNAAEKNMNVKGMMKFDHPLNEAGRMQASNLNRAWLDKVAARKKGDELLPSETKSLEADCIFTSPLTRATQTALLALEGHPTVEHDGIKLLRAVREIKHIGGFDTVGKEVGAGIAERVHHQFSKSFKADRVSSLMKRKNGEEVLDEYDCTSVWWTKRVDQKSNLFRRMDELTNTLQYHGANTIILVGHSLLSKEIFKRFCTEEFIVKNKSLADNMFTKKMPNASCMML